MLNVSLLLKCTNKANMMNASEMGMKTFSKNRIYQVFKIKKVAIKGN